MKTITFNGKRYKVYRSQRKGKKFKIKYGSSEIHFGASGYRIAPSTKKGDRYCARSSGIRTKTTKKPSPNTLSRKMWKCKAKRSIR
jgi:hypothetical protein